MIIREYIFEMNTDRHGRIRVKRITLGAMREIIKRLPNYKTRSGYDVTLTCASVLCIGDQDKVIDAAQLSDMELEEFAEKLLANRIRVQSVNGVPVNELPRKEGESSVEYCARVIADEIGSYHDQMTSFVEKSGFLSAANEINRLSGADSGTLMRLMHSVGDVYAFLFSPPNISAILFTKAGSDRVVLPMRRTQSPDLASPLSVRPLNFVPRLYLA